MTGAGGCIIAPAKPPEGELRAPTDNLKKAHKHESKKEVDNVYISISITSVHWHRKSRA